MDERTLNDLLECSVCLERLDTSSKVLPCQHTFCRKCLEVIFSSRQELRCPECRVLVDVKIDELPPNVLLMRILEGMKNAAAAKTQQQESSKIQNDNKIENTLKLNEEQQQQIKLKQQQLLLYQQQQQQQQQQFKHKQHQIHLQALHQQQQQLQQSQQQHATHSNNITTTAATTTTSAIHPPQQRRLVPHAYALYDFESNEPTDLHFKKSDIILLKRKVDINWFVGEINGVEGTFPTNYVQVIVPLPSPQCIALYDFKMGPNEEEGCLTFKKGTLIHVLRRVDHNWAEGRINSTIGIFPIAFVELNPLAKQLLDSYVVLNSPPPPPPIVAQYPQQQQQNTPKNQPNQLVCNNINAQQQQQSPQNQQHAVTPRNLPPIPTDTNANAKTPDTTSSSSSRSSQISPNSNTSCSSNTSSSSSLPSSPNQSNPTSPLNSSSIRYRDCKEKRHSLNALLSLTAGGGVAPALSVVQSNRHSAEILSVPSDISVPSAGVGIQNLHILRNSNEGLLSTQTVASTVATAAVNSLPATTQNAADREQQQSLASTSRVNVLKTGGQQNVPPILPWGYLALYPYKPRKSDELELKKGCVYVVTERCLDGWFKGKNWQDISGVFPGNYVTPLRNRDQQQLMHQWKFVQNHSPLQQTTVQPNATQNKLHIAGNLSHQPPELPPRQSPSSAPYANPTSGISSAISTSVWSKPLGHTVEAFFSRKSNSTQEQQEDNTATTPKEKQKDNSSTTTSGGGASSTAVSLMKRLTQIKTRSKSPGNAVVNNIIAATQKQQPSAVAYSMDNPSFEDSPQVVQQGTAYIKHSHGSNLHPVHVRSGSCPSQLLQSLPTDLQTVQNSESNRTQNQNKQQHSQPPYGGSQRIKGCKERPQLQNVRQSSDGTLRNVLSNINNAVPMQQQQQQQQQQSLTKCGQQAQHQQQTNFNNTAVNHRKSQSLDANTISAQIKSPSTIEVGRSAPVNQNPRESRFRCVVSYPPNSELELELHVGDIVYVHRKQKSGWYKGTHARTNKTGLFPASFVEPDI